MAAVYLKATVVTAVGWHPGNRQQALGNFPLRVAQGNIDRRLCPLARLHHVIPLSTLWIGKHLEITREQLREKAKAVRVTWRAICRLSRALRLGASYGAAVPGRASRPPAARRRPQCRTARTPLPAWSIWWQAGGPARPHPSQGSSASRD